MLAIHLVMEDVVLTNPREPLEFSSQLTWGLFIAKLSFQGAYNIRIF